MNIDRELLDEVAKLMDLVDVTLCDCIYKYCKIDKNKLFKSMRGTEFIDFLNLMLEPERVKIIAGANQRIYYLIHFVSQHLVNSAYADAWVNAMLEICHYDYSIYKKHRLDVLQEAASRENKNFAEDIKTALERADFINKENKGT